MKKQGKNTKGLKVSKTLTMFFLCFVMLLLVVKVLCVEDLDKSEVLWYIYGLIGLL